MRRAMYSFWDTSKFGRRGLPGARRYRIQRLSPWIVFKYRPKTPIPRIDQPGLDNLITRAHSILMTNADIETTPATLTLETLIEGHEVSDPRKESLRIALELGADLATLTALRDSLRVSRKTTVVLPKNRLEGLSRGRGWARQGKGTNVVWGERVDGGYRVGPGRWSVGATDGFNRKRSDDWKVEHIQVGSETWTIGN
jgi:hypothetical protein